MEPPSWYLKGRGKGDKHPSEVIWNWRKKAVVVQEKGLGESNARQKMARGELTPTAAKRQVLQQGSRSPGAQERSLARLLRFQQRLCEEHNLPPSHLQERRRLGETSSPSSSPRLRPALARSREGGLDLREEFERIGAEALLLPVTTPLGAQEGGEQEDHYVRSPGGSRGGRPTSDTNMPYS